MDTGSRKDSSARLDLNQLRIPEELMFFEAPASNVFLILNPEIGTFITLPQNEFIPFQNLAQNREVVMATNDLAQVMQPLVRLILRKVVYYGSYKPTLNETVGTVPKSVYWETTHGCSLRCVYCYMSADTVRPGELTTDEAKNVIGQMAELGVKRLVFTGGEALIRKDIYTLGTHAKERGLTTEVITNATLINTLEVARQVKACFDYVITSLDGACPEHNDVHRGKGSFELIKRGLKLLNEVGVEPSINSVVSDANVDYTEELLEFVHETFKVRAHRLMHISKLGRGDETERDMNWENYKKLHDATLARARRLRDYKPEVIAKSLSKNDLMPRKNCGMGSGEIYIDSQGNVYPCKLVTTRDWYSGNVRQASLAEILSASPLQKARDLSVSDIKGCRSCIIRRLCGGGCRGNHLGGSGDALTNDPQFCWTLRHRMISQLWTVEGQMEVLNEKSAYVPRRLNDGQVWQPEIGTALPDYEMAIVIGHLQRLQDSELPLA